MIFTRRGGYIIFSGITLIGVGIAIAGYMATQIFVAPFVNLFFPDFYNNPTDFGWAYPNKTSGHTGSDLLQVFFGLGMEFLIKLATGTIIIVDDQITTYFIVIGTMMILSVLLGYPFFTAGAKPYSVEITRKLHKTRLFAGDYLYVEITARNTSLNQIPVIEIYDAIPEVFDLSLGDNSYTAQLDPKSSITYSYVVRIPIRGIFFLGPTKVILHDRQGFYSQEAILAETTELLVYPSYEDVKKMEVIGKKRQLGALFGAHRTKIKGMGTDFFGIRRYEPGDPFKTIDWKAFSKTGKLMVREFEAEQNIRVVIMIDSSESMGAGLARNTKLEYAIRAAVLLSHIAMEKRDMVGLAIFDEEVRAWYEPSSSPKAMFRIMEALAYAVPQKKKRITHAVEEIMKRLTRASLFIILSDLETKDDDVLEAVKKLRAQKNRVMIISPFGPWFEIMQHELSPFDKLLGEAIVEELVGKRRELFKKLQKYEVISISVGPDDFLPTIMSEFAKAKQKGMGAV